jgi:hypothetical protein
MNPLIPGVGDVLWAILAFAHAVLAIVALVSMVRAADRRRWWASVLLILFLPVIGPILVLVDTRTRLGAPRAR